MSLSARQTEQKLMCEIRTAIDRPSFAHVVAEILVHEPAPPDARPCWCCGSTHARISERIDDGELLIDRETGRRIRPERLKPETWRRAVALAERFEIKFRVSRQQLPLLLDDSDRHVLCAGGHRSGKTTIALLWVVRQWLRRGGRRRRFWFIGETHEKAHELVKAIFEGDGIAPPILPSGLALKRPTTHKAGDLNTHMLDGSLWQLRRFNADPTAGGLKSRPIVAGITDEAAEMKHPNALTALKGRCLDLRGRLFLSTSPVASSFLRGAVVEQCEDWARMPDDHPAKVAAEHVGAQWISANLSLLDNPWLDRDAVRRDIAAQDQEAPSFKRDYRGLWVVGCGPLWAFDDSRHTFTHEARRCVDMAPQVDALAGCPQRIVTPAVVRRLFQTHNNPHYKSVRATNTTYILGADVNCSPMTSVVVEVTGDASDPENRNKFHLWVHDCETTVRGHSLAHAERLASTTWARAWAPAVTESPLKGCGIILDPTSFGRDPTAHRFGGNPQGIAAVFGDLGFDARAPQYQLDGMRPLHIARRDSHMLIHRLLHEGRLHVSRRAARVIKSFHEQEQGPDGVTPLVVSHSASDRLANPVDGIRYLAHAVFHSGASS